MNMKYNYTKPTNIRFRIIEKKDLNGNVEYWIYRKNWFGRWQRSDFFNSYESNGFDTLEDAKKYLIEHHIGHVVEKVVYEA